MKSEKVSRSERARGRPPAHLAGEVDERILETASEMFLERGFDATSCEQVAAHAGCGKASIYARYADKSELFAASIHHILATSRVVPTEGSVTSGTERLASVCKAVLERALSAKAVRLKRLLIAEAARCPDLVAQANRHLRDGAVAHVASALAGTSTSHATAELEVAARLVDIALAPLELSALLGETLSAVRSRVPASVEGAVALLTLAGVLAKHVVLANEQ